MVIVYLECSFGVLCIFILDNTKICDSLEPIKQKFREARAVSDLSPSSAQRRAVGATGAAVGPVAWEHSSLAVDDMDRAAGFFRDAFGFEEIFSERRMAGQIESITGSPGMRCDLIQMRLPASRHVLELIAFAPAGGALPPDALPVRPGASHVAFAVADLAAARRAVEALGAVVLGRLTKFDDGPAIYCRVPGGAFIELAEALPA
jgi:catechol 2,3-dioxygenase-like lactoylglutathione lyase family enzyme